MLGECHLYHAMVTSSMIVRINIIKLSWGSPRGGQCKADDRWFCRSAEISGKAVKWVICPPDSPLL